MTGNAFKAEATGETAGDDCSDLVSAAESSTRFWDNSLDDEDWNATEEQYGRMEGDHEW